MTVDTVLVLEDNVLIALDLAGILEDMGRTVVGPCHSSAEALACIEAEPPDFAIIDYNLGAETSEAVADRLIGRNIPFAFLTGHAARHLPARFAEAPILVKPVSPHHLERLWTRG